MQPTEIESALTQSVAEKEQKQDSREMSEQSNKFALPAKSKWTKQAGKGSDAPFHGMQSLQGKWRGWIKASGRGMELDDREGVKFTLKGEDWEYGDYALQALRVAGKFNSMEGLKVDRLQVEADDASLRVHGSLLGEKQNRFFH